MIHDSSSSPVFSFKTMQVANSSQGQEFEVLLSDLKRNTGYGIIVQAFNHKGSGPASEEVMGHTKEFGQFICFSINDHSFIHSFQTDAPSVVDVKVLSSTPNSLTLAFDGQSEETPVTGYIINFKTQNTNWDELKVTGKRTTYRMENLRCGTKYHLTLVSYNSAGRSPSSPILTTSTTGDGQSMLRQT